MCEALKELMKDEYEAMYQYFETTRQEIETSKQEIETSKQEIETSKQEIETSKQEIETSKQEILNRGVTEGRERTLISLILRKLKKRKPLETIALELEEEPDTIKEIYDMAAAHPEDSAERIYQYLHPMVS